MEALPLFFGDFKEQKKSDKYIHKKSHNDKE